MNAKQTVLELLAKADIRVDGKRDGDIAVHDERFYKRVLRQGALGLGESYMDGWWDAKHIDNFVSKAFSAELHKKIQLSPMVVKSIVTSALFNRQSKRRALKNAAHHYNIGNDLYERMLDKRMIYTCAYWKHAKTLDQAQEAKLDLICRKLHLKKGMTVLDIGCGWGGFAAYAAKKYGAIVTGITPAFEQYKLAKERTTGLSVKILQKDYRDMRGKFDRIVSIGMMEAVGPKNFKAFFTTCNNLLKSGGIMLHHTIGNNRSVLSTNPWIDKYIFPGGVIPSMSQISKAIEKQLIIEDVHNIGPDYDKTLMSWCRNFIKAYPALKDKYDQRFYRMWTLYLMASAGMFRARKLQLWQIVFRKIEPSERYESLR